MGQSRFVIVANTLPVRLTKRAGEERWTPSPGGLVSALSPIAADQQGAWLGWSGEVDKERRPFRHEGIRNVPIPISAKDVRDSYEGVCNRTLWPLYHHAVRHPEYHRRWWRQYRQVSERFAESAAREAAPGAVVWVHDYHLQLVPGMLRRLRSDLRIGFFLHIPFPPAELFMRLPWRRQVLEGILGADVIGFQTRSDVRNFIDLVRRYMDVRRFGRRLRYDGRHLTVDAYPISIDTQRFEEMARRPEVQQAVERLQARLGRGRKVFLGVDRLDYTKGIDLRLKAFQQLLSSRSDYKNEAVLVQIAVPSRERIAEYKELRTEVEGLVGQINGQFGEVGTAAVHYLRRTLSFVDLVAMYRAADIMLVTPLCDGMNLVSKEFVATRFDHTGTLVLSEFAGAAAELKAALQVNPHDVDGLAEMMDRAMTMPRNEARRRMRSLRRKVRLYSVHEWARKFLADLEP